MDPKERVRRIFAGGEADRVGFWLGNPHEDTWPIYLDHFGFQSREELRRFLGDDLRWISAEWDCWHDPDGGPIFDWQKQGRSHGAPGAFAQCEDPAEVEDFPWPDPRSDYLDFSATIRKLEEASKFYCLSGMWAPFYHHVEDAFGMKNFFLKLHTHPKVVQAVLEKICNFYLEANERFLREAGDLVDGFFFGNDFGTQRDLQISPEHFDRFVMPWFKKFVDQGHAHDCQVVLHSCGSVHRVIDRLIDAGVDALHPLQAKAKDMDAETLAEDFGGEIAFLGGIDTQDLLVNASPEGVREEVERVKELLGPSLVVSPSHEALLPNVPPENALAMAQAARG